jgi:Fur family ferric uptake transcriptional regulator
MSQILGVQNAFCAPSFAQNLGHTLTILESGRNYQAKTKFFDNFIFSFIIDLSSHFAETQEARMSSIVGLADQIKSAGYKLTPARLAVVEVLETNPEHLSHNQILQEGQKIYPKLSRATVYRTIDLLVELQAIRPLYLNDPTQRFVSAEGGHHHLVCTSCDATIEFDHCTADQLAQELATQYNFQIHNHLLEFQGLCAACQQI